MNLAQAPWLTEPTVDAFIALLRRRLSAGVFTTEDSIRYTFFAALLQAGVRPEQIVLEYPHPAIPGAEVDTVVLTDFGQAGAAFEFKYDRGIKSGKNLPRPQKAGAALADLIRLLKWSGCPELYFFYVTDKELAGYWGTPSNGLDTIFNLPCGRSITVDATHFSEQAPTLHKAMGEWPGPALLSTVACADLPADHYLRLYRVRSAQP